MRESYLENRTRHRMLCHWYISLYIFIHGAVVINFSQELNSSFHSYIDKVMKISEVEVILNYMDGIKTTFSSINILLLNNIRRWNQDL